VQQFAANDVKLFDMEVVIFLVWKIVTIFSIWRKKALLYIYYVHWRLIL